MSISLKKNMQNNYHRIEHNNNNNNNNFKLLLYHCIVQKSQMGQLLNYDNKDHSSVSSSIFFTNGFW